VKENVSRMPYVPNWEQRNRERNNGLAYCIAFLSRSQSSALLYLDAVSNDVLMFF
jgi:hypothetical protein